MTLGNEKVARDSQILWEKNQWDRGTYWMRKLYRGQKDSEAQ